jgi:hypothetical protein
MEHEHHHHQFYAQFIHSSLRVGKGKDAINTSIGNANPVIPPRRRREMPQ